MLLPETRLAGMSGSVGMPCKIIPLKCAWLSCDLSSEDTRFSKVVMPTLVTLQEVFIWLAQASLVSRSSAPITSGHLHDQHVTSLPICSHSECKLDPMHLFSHINVWPMSYIFTFPGNLAFYLSYARKIWSFPGLSVLLQVTVKQCYVYFICIVIHSIFICYVTSYA